MSHDSDPKSPAKARAKRPSMRVPSDPVPRVQDNSAAALSTTDDIVKTELEDVPTLITGPDETMPIHIVDEFDQDDKTEVTPDSSIVPLMGGAVVAASMERIESGEVIDDDMLEELESSDALDAVNIEIEESTEVGQVDVENKDFQTSPATMPPKPPPSTSKTKSRQSRTWVDQVFNEDYLRTLPFLTPKATQTEASFVADSLELDSGARILDVGCGYGRHAMELAAQGYDIVGLDNSLPLLLRGADEAQRRGLSINFVHGDMRDMNFDTQFDGAYCLFSSFGFFDDDVNKRSAQQIADSLKPGARFVIEVLNRDYLVSDLPSRVWWEGDGCVVLEEVAFNYFSSRIVSNRSLVFDDGRQLEQEISLRTFSLHEIGKLLHSVGFRVVEISGSMSTRGRFFGAYSRDLVVVAEKRELS